MERRAGLPPSVQLVLDRFHVDWYAAEQPPPVWRVGLATVVSVLGSLMADGFLVWVATKLYPGTDGYVHFQFRDYARLTVIGVVGASAAWPVVTRVSSMPRWLFFRSAVAIMLVLWLPDAYLLVTHQPADAVAVLMLMHLAIALVTYNALVHLAPSRTRSYWVRSSPAAPSANVQVLSAGRDDAPVRA